MQVAFVCAFRVACERVKVPDRSERLVKARVEEAVSWMARLDLKVMRWALALIQISQAGHLRPHPSFPYRSEENAQLSTHEM